LRPASSTSTPDRGSGAARHRHRATGGGSLRTAFEERSTSKPRSIGQGGEQAARRGQRSRPGASGQALPPHGPGRPPHP
jgi:hypothetical protein